MCACARSGVMTSLFDKTNLDKQRIAKGLAALLVGIAALDAEERYDDRNRTIFVALSLAAMAGYACGIRFDVETPEWPVVFIELPTGQVSWHLPQHTTAWDGHTTFQKYE